MARQIIKQPDGLYAIWSTVVDDFIFVNGTREDIVEFYVEEAVKAAEQGINVTIDKLDKGENPYYQFAYTFDECVRIIKSIHGKDAESLKYLGLGENENKSS